MADDQGENEGVRILGAEEARELARSGKAKVSKEKSVTKTTSDNTADVDLPHWSEAPTGEVAAVKADEIPQDGWEALTGSQPRLRVDQNEWNDVDYDPELNLKDDSLSVGALGDDHITLDDSDEEFEKTVAEKRGISPTPESASGETIKIQDSDLGASEPRITRISTVPDDATTEPVTGSSSVIPGQAPSKIRATFASRRNRSKGESKQEGDRPAELPASEMNVLITRTITAVALGVVAVICFVLGTIPTLILSAVAITLMSLELCSAFRKIGAKPAALMVGGLSFFSVIAGYLVGDRAVALGAFTFFVFAALWYLFAVVKARPVIGLGISSLVYLYVGVLGSFAGMILGLENNDGESIGVFVLLSTVLCVAANDTGAYLFGKSMGRTQLAPAISPNKTLEGTTAGMIAAVIVGLALALSSSGDVWGGVKGGILLGALLAIASILGDLVESMLKRDCKLKDFGAVLPGHGGLMDRFDGLLFALPVAYYFALVLL